MSEKSLADRVVAITSASSGIGEANALALDCADTAAAIIAALVQPAKVSIGENVVVHPSGQGM